MSSSADGDLTAGQNVTYHVRFDITTATNFGGFVVEFCEDTPIIGDTNTNCNLINSTYSFNIGAPTVSGQSDGSGTDPIIPSITDDCNISTFTTASALTTHTLSLTAGTPVALAANATCFFDITTVRNPNVPNHTFFARIYAYSEAAEATGYTLANPNAGTGTVNDADGNANNDDDFVDAGGVALSTAEQITVTAKVPEKLTFCVFTTDGTPANTCGQSTPVSGNAITLGDNNGVLKDNEEFVNKDAKYSVATNALFGVAIRIKGGTLKTSPACAETAGQTCSIDAIGNTATANAEGTEQFGFCSYQSVGSGLTPASPYNDAECNTTVDNAGDVGNGTADDAAVAGTAFAFDNNNTTGTTSTYGQTFADKISGTFSTGVIAFLGNITTTTEPGIYTTTLTFIATGTY